MKLFLISLTVTLIAVLAWSQQAQAGWPRNVSSAAMDQNAVPGEVVALRGSGGGHHGGHFIGHGDRGSSDGRVFRERRFDRDGDDRFLDVWPQRSNRCYTYYDSYLGEYVVSCGRGW